MEAFLLWPFAFWQIGTRTLHHYARTLTPKKAPWKQPKP